MATDAGSPAENDRVFLARQRPPTGETIQRIYIFDDRIDEELAALFEPSQSPSPSAHVADPATADGAEPTLPFLNLDQLRRQAVRQALAVAGGHRGRAAALLGVSLNTMTRLASEACPEMRAKRGRRRVNRPR